MAWILLEAFVALALGLFIVWWTMRGRRRHPQERPSDESHAAGTATRGPDDGTDGTRAR
jgi:hypothetical protein